MYEKLIKKVMLVVGICDFGIATAGLALVILGVNAHIISYGLLLISAVLIANACE
jgi:hypothetical protein